MKKAPKGLLIVFEKVDGEKLRVNFDWGNAAGSL